MAQVSFGVRCSAWASMLGLGIISSACLVREPVLFEEPELSFEAQVSRRWHANGTRAREERVLAWSDGRIERHGPSRGWFESGQLKYERFYDHGLGIKLWRSWYGSGVLESKVELLDGATLAPMQFFYESGQPKAAGDGIAGSRQGLWSYWHPNGQLAEQGEYSDMVKVGLWKRWSPRGELMVQAEGST